MKLYDILEIKNNADSITIRKAYYRLAKKYHPDKNKNTKDKFQEINYAYHILINNESRKRYDKLNKKEDINFIDYIKNIISKKISIDYLKKINIMIDNIINYKSFDNIINTFDNMNIDEIFRFFMKDKITIQELNTNHMDSEVEYFNSNQANYYYKLPIQYIEPNNNNINININIEIDMILNNTMKKIKIKRNINNNIIHQNFIFSLNKPYIVFHNCGDNNNGHLIILLNLKNNIMWNKKTIMFSKDISCKEYFNGININNILWNPYSDGNIYYDDNISYKFNIREDELNKIKSNCI
jgi:curved DNA-binding protein CbpA